MSKPMASCKGNVNREVRNSVYIKKLEKHQISGLIVLLKNLEKAQTKPQIDGRK